MSPTRALPRPAALRDLLGEITAAAVGLVLFLLILAFLSGEGTVALTSDGGVSRLELTWVRPLWSGRLATIFFWDLVLFFAVSWGLRFCPASPAPTPAPEPGLSGMGSGHREETFLTLVMTLILWRVVVGSVGTLLFGAPGENPFNAGAGIPAVGETLLILGVLVIGKLRLAQRLEEADRRLDSPLLAVCCWHHRKDAIFNLLFIVALVAAWTGFNPGRLDQWLHFVKLGLLGTAALTVAVRCARRLTRPSASAVQGQGIAAC